MSETSIAELEPPRAPASGSADESAEKRRLFLAQHRERLKELIKDPKHFKALYTAGVEKKRAEKRLTLDETIACVGYAHYKESAPKKDDGKHGQARETSDITGLRNRKAIFDEFFNLIEAVLDRDWPKYRLQILGRTKEDIRRVVRTNKQRIESDFLVRGRKCLSELEKIRDWFNKHVTFTGRKQLIEMERAEANMGGSGGMAGGGALAGGSEIETLLKAMGIE